MDDGNEQDEEFRDNVRGEDGSTVLLESDDHKPGILKLSRRGAVELVELQGELEDVLQDNHQLAKKQRVWFLFFFFLSFRSK